MSDTKSLTNIIGLSCTIALGFFAMGYSFSCFNVLTNILHPQYVEHGKDIIKDKDVFNSVIWGLVPVGAIFGAILGDPLARIGKRFAVILIALIYTFASILILVFNFYTLVAARFIMGLCIGAYATICPMMISEVAPEKLAGPLGVLPQCMWILGQLVALSLSFIVPYSESLEALTTQTWKLIFSFSGLFTAAQLILMTFWYKDQDPKPSNPSNYQFGEMISNDFAFNFWDSKVKLEIEQSGLTPLTIGILLSFFHQATGIGIVTFYSNELFTNGHTGQEAEFTARVGTFGTGAIAVLSAMIAILASKHFGRRSILLAGELWICLIYAMLYSMSIQNNHLMVKVFTVAFVFVFNCSFGPILWPYASEILSPRGVTIVATSNMMFTSVFGSFGNLFFKYLQASGVYMLLFLIQILWIAFVYLYMMETKGKSKEEWKRLYSSCQDSEVYTRLDLSP